MGPIPEGWMPAAAMTRVHLHWTAGAHKANAVDLRAYHILVEGDGTLQRGKASIALNAAPVKPGYAAHTLNANSGAIGVSLCGMAGAQEKPFRPGPYPLTSEQWDAGVAAIAQLCARYKIPVTRKTVLSHAEVQANLGIRQRNKWDITVLPFDPSVVGARAIGDRLRAEVIVAMGGVSLPTTAVTARPLLKKGDTGNDVADLQRLLRAAGFDPVYIDGDFGKLTHEALGAFQASVRLESGVADDDTWEALTKPAQVPATTAPALTERLTEPVPHDRPLWAYRLWRALGRSREAAVVMVGNAQQEAYADLRTDARGDAHLPGGSIGIYQWNDGPKGQFKRRTNFLAYCQDNGLDPLDLEANIRFADHELRHEERTAGNMLDAAQTIWSANIAAMAYLRPQDWSALYPQGGHGWKNRLDNALRLDARITRD